ncbi:F-box/kelch-repeat protein At3g23880-like [Tripterygium wilfordii]|uniref:F-box/kelch-repeat protein At3g23880-like n=1 Tax=Tripterygium wilfordii TaxID=458696 RepID=UPI0018F82100|nr:F-box/kelch-repeat protein At3g23880-like [Tripterygium wilfordii]
MEDLKIMEIPEDLVTDILLYLPVKSLRRFRCVCKSWCDLFENPSFVTEHHHKQITLNSDVRFVIGRDYSSTYEPIISIIKDDGDEIPSVTEAISFVSVCFGKFNQVLGPINGLYCVCGDEFFTIWNPATREIKRLPDSQLLPPNLGITLGHVYGFGFDNKSNDYKVLRIVDYLLYMDESTRHIEIYSLKSESWRKLPDMEMDVTLLRFTMKNVCKDEVYYWWGMTEKDFCILSFDMADEVFETMPLPSLGIPCTDFNGSFGFNGCFGDFLAELAIFNGSLAVIAYPKTGMIGGYGDIWVMAAKETWVKQASIGPICAIQRPLGLWKNGGLFIEDIDRQLLLYESSGSIKKLPFHFPLQVLNYEESLVPINGRK